MKIQKFREYSSNELMANDFINSFDLLITESEQVKYESIRKKVFSDLRLNGNLSLTFGVGINALYPVVDSLIRNMNISSIELTTEKIVLLTICVFTIIYLEEKKFKSSNEEDVIRKDIKSMLEELKMSGLGNGIVKKMVDLFKSFVNIFNTIYRHIGKAIGSFIDMFAYVGILIPIINAISYIVGKYELNMDTFILNFKGLALGLGTIIAKHGISYILSKLKGIDINKDKVLSAIKIDNNNDNIPKPGEEMITEQ